MSSDMSYYNSYKEERDLILEYNQVDLSDISIININGVGIDNLTREQAVVKVMRMIEDGGVHHVIPMNPYKLMRFKSNEDLRVVNNMANMRIAAGAGLEWAARTLKSPIKERIHLLSFIMDIVRISEIKEYSIFLVGAKPETVEKAFFNIKKSFPAIRIVGRHGGFFSPEREKSVVEAMRKSEAKIILVGLGFPKEDRWIKKIRGEFKNAVFISVQGSLDIISGEIKKAPAHFMEKGLDWFYRIITRPWRYGRLLRVILFFIQVLFKRVLMKKK